jgi:hypothetical protein
VRTATAWYQHTTTSAVALAATVGAVPISSARPPGCWHAAGRMTASARARCLCGTDRLTLRRARSYGPGTHTDLPLRGGDSHSAPGTANPTGAGSRTGRCRPAVRHARPVPDGPHRHRAALAPPGIPPTTGARGAAPWSPGRRAAVGADGLGGVARALPHARRFRAGPKPRECKNRLSGRARPVFDTLGDDALTAPCTTGADMTRWRPSAAAAA